MPNRGPKNKPVTLYPLDFEQAVRRVLQAPNPRLLEQERDASGDPLEPPKKAPQSKRRG